MAKSVSGQAAVEYVLVLVIFTGVAIESWKVLYPTISAVYQKFSDRRAGVVGLLP